MKFTDIFIRRPVFATVLSLLLLLIGIISYSKLTVRQFPTLDASVISISTSYSGASASIMENYITTPIENAVAGVDGIDYITSSSTEGSSTVKLNFKLGTNINDALTDVSSKLSAALKQLPSGVNNPTISKQDPNSMPIMVITFTNPNMTAEQVTDYLSRVVQPELATVDGVGEAKILGGSTYAMRIWLNPALMAAHDVTAAEVQTALKDNNVQTPAGSIQRKYQLLAISAETDLSTADEFGNLIIKRTNNSLIKLKDVAKIKLSSADQVVSVNVNGKPTVSIGIIPKSDANPLDISSAINKLLPSIQASLPTGMTSTIARDTTTYISKSIDEVNSTIIEATIFVILVIFLFIGSIRSVLIPVVTIPLSLLGVCGFMLAMGYSINTLTLLAFVLAIGLVVDDAIVVLENIHRQMEKGLKPFEAAITGAREIGFAVIAMTLTLAAVYAPIGFTSGLTGSLFREFAFTLAGTVIVSGFIALTLSPMMCSKIMKPGQHDGKLVKFIDKIFNKVETGYKNLLTNSLSIRPIILLIAGSILVLGVILFYGLYQNRTLAPKEDQGTVLGIVMAPTNANLAYTQKYTNQLAEIMSKAPAMEKYGVINGIPTGQNTAFAFLGLKPWSDRNVTATQVIQYLNPKVSHIAGINTAIVNPPSLPGSSGFFPVQFVIKTTGSYDDLNTVVNKFMKAISKNPGVTHVQSDLQLNQAGVNIKVNRSKARNLGVSMSTIGNALNFLLGEPTASTFIMNGDTYDVIPSLDKNQKNNPADLNNINVATSSGKLVPLSNLVSISNAVVPSALNHFQQQRSATLNVAISKDYNTAEAVAYLENLSKQYLSSDMTYDFAGQTRQFIDSSDTMAQTFLFALLFIFLVLSAQFESFRDPLIVMFSVPLSLVGAMIAMYFTGGSLNIYTEIGLITLVGLISKHGILIVEFANQQQEKFENIKDAVISAATIRLRPILMTTSAMVLGAFPLAIASGAGAHARQQMGWVIIGGMLFGTFFTLFVIPTVYSLLASKQKKHVTVPANVVHEG